MRGLILLLMLSFSVLADGMYVAPSTYVLPEVTAQQALLVHHEGIETMVIASTLDSQSQELGWIIPVPAKPTALKKANPGVLKVFDMQSGPKIYNDISASAFVFPIWLLILVIGCQIDRMLSKGKPFNLLRFVVGLLLLVCHLFLGGMLYLAPTVGSSGVNDGATVYGVTVHDQVQVGHYQTSVIEAQNPHALNVWLKTNGLAELPENAVNVAKDYIAQNWVFCCFRLTRSDAGLNTPHPVQISFPSEQLIYPMQFTALTGESAHFDLFTLTDKHVACEDLETKVSVPLTYQEKSEDDVQPLWVNEGEEIRLGGNLMESLASKKPVFGRFSGKLDFRSGEHPDLRFSVNGEFKARTWQMAPRAFWFWWFAILLWLAVVWLVVGALMNCKKIGRKLRIIGGFSVLLLAGLWFTPLVNKMVIEFEPEWSPFHLELYTGQATAMTEEAYYEGVVADNYQMHSRLKLARYPDWEGDLTIRNIYTTQPIKLEESPGNIWVEKHADGTFEAYFIDEAGRRNCSASEVLSRDRMRRRGLR